MSKRYQSGEGFGRQSRESGVPVPASRPDQVLELPVYRGFRESHNAERRVASMYSTSSLGGICGTRVCGPRQGSIVQSGDVMSGQPDRSAQRAAEAEKCCKSARGSSSAIQWPDCRISAVVTVSATSRSIADTSSPPAKPPAAPAVARWPRPSSCGPMSAERGQHEVEGRAPFGLPVAHMLERRDQRRLNAEHGIGLDPRIIAHKGVRDEPLIARRGD